MTDSVNSAKAGPPAVSVVIPAFDAERTLAATLDSVRAQTFTNFEAIVVDDGSADRTHAIAREYAERDDRFRVISQPNQGVAEARNAGLRMSRAPLVAPLDSDDLWHPTYIEKLRRALATGGPDVVFAFASFRRIDLNGEVLSSAPQYDVEGRAFNRLLVQNFVGNGSGMMFRRDAALAVGGYEPRLQHEFGAQGCEDLLLQLHLAARGSVVAVREYLVGYRIVPGAMSSDQLRMMRSLVHALEILFEDLDVGSEQSARWALGRAKAQCMVHEFMFGDLDAALRSLRAALVNDLVGTFEMIFAGTDRATRRLAKRLLRRVRPVPTRGSFHEFHPLQDRRQIRSRLTRWRFKRLGEVDLRVPRLPVDSRDRSPVASP